MINHIRTLLLNVSGANKADVNYPGEEFVPTDFNAVVLPQAIQAIKNVLFGVNPDRAMLNYRLRQYMNILHSTELQEYVTALDSRITYWPLVDDNLFRLLAFGAVATCTTTPIRHLNFSAAPNILTASSKLLLNYEVSITDGSAITIKTTSAPAAVKTVSYSTVSGYTAPIAFPGLQLYFSGESVVGTTWAVDVLCKPIVELPAILTTLDKLAEVHDSGLFGRGDGEPYETFLNLWQTSTELPYRLGGLLLALAYRTNALLPANGG